MVKKENRNEMRKIRHERIRKQISGTKDIPRLCVYRSNMNIKAQLVDDIAGVTLAEEFTAEQSIDLLQNGTVFTSVAFTYSLPEFDCLSVFFGVH